MKSGMKKKEKMKIEAFNASKQNMGPTNVGSISSQGRSQKILLGWPLYEKDFF